MTRLLPLLLLVSCGPYQLASRIGGPVSTRQLDIIECREVAHEWSSRPEAQVRGFAAGFFLPVVGIAVGMAAERDDSRAAFGRCMTERGYTVVVGRD